MKTRILAIDSRSGICYIRKENRITGDDKEDTGQRWPKRAGGGCDPARRLREGTLEPE